MAATDVLRGRQTATRTLTNKSGGAVVQGDVVVIGDGTNDNAFTTTTTAAFKARMVGVAMEAIAANAAGLVAIHGYVPIVNSAAGLTRDHFLSTSTVAKEATGAAARAAGAFGQVLESATDPEAIIWGMPDSTPAAPALVFLEAQTASASASLDFTTFISSTYDTYKIEIVQLRPATDTASIYIEMGTGAGPTYDTGNNYEWAADGRTTGGAAVTYEGATGLCPIFPTMSNNAGYGFGAASLTLYDPQSTTQRRTMHGSVYYVTSTGPAARQVHWGMQYSALGTALTALRFIASSGNITSGTIRIYGVAKS